MSLRASWSRALCGVALALSACGGGGGGTTIPPTPPPNPLFVAPNGRDSNLGDQGHPLATVTEAAQIALNGHTIIVAPGTYRQTVTTERHGHSEAQALTFIADVTGARSARGAGPVVIDAHGLGGTQVFTVSSSAGSIVDGFTVTGGAGIGIVISSGSSDVQVRNCIVHDNADDGIHVQDSSNAVVFNNLIYGNAGSGLNIGGQGAGSPQAVIVNNTIFGNQFRGVNIGTTSAPSSGAFLRNDIVQNNGQDFSIKVFALPNPNSLAGYDADFNLVLPATYFPSQRQIGGIHDIAHDAQFVNAGAGDFHLRASSPAIDAGDSLNRMQTLANALRNLTTTGGTNCDKSALDLGYHYPPSGRCTAVGP